ncbi:class I SAM-dependent methyltransferase [Paenibacillus hunanensis]|uniref:class I SAM-dependent methyltransferase n=1 Tax=Paenibacillus hunanensis TaxID=539262 RepID=UPI002A699049|nr:class I SAM-dependent methyltransferase [Paenibacillus hunanensis]WPP42079.1 class I SAM-dependent methyltransferase [Paenibacillus hunanensis]
MDYTGERFIPNNDGLEIEAEHMHRYNSIAESLKGMRVLDAGCGTGYGSFLISQFAKKVIGIDISQEAVDWCNKNYASQKNLEFTQGSLEAIPFDSEEFDCVVSFEVIEHVDSNIQRAFLREARRVLKKNGVLIISTPNKLIYTDKSGYHNPFHIHEFYEDEFKQFLSQEFAVTKLYSQSLYTVSSIYGDIKKNDNVKMFQHSSLDSSGKYMIALCSNTNKIIPSIKLDSVYKFDNPGGIHFSSLYVGTENNDYSQSQKETAVLLNHADNKFSITFDLSAYSQISKFRFDPVEDNFCICNIEEILTDGKLESTAPLNALKYHKQGFLFMNIDPQFEIAGDFSNATYITIQGYFKILSQSEISEFVDYFYQKMIEATEKAANDNI